MKTSKKTDSQTSSNNAAPVRAAICRARNESRIKSAVAIARNMKASGYAPSFISECTGLSVTIVEGL